jgi:hypothetical protein
MTEIDGALRATLDELVPPFAADADWADVLRRAGVRRAGRASPRAAVAIAALAAGIALLAAPALGLGDRLRELVGADARDDVALFRARLAAPDGTRAGSFTVAVESRDVRRPGAGRLRLFTGPLRWTLTYRGVGGAPRAAHVHVGRRSYTLCAPCPPMRASGTLARSTAHLLASDRAAVDVHGARGAGAALRGRVESLIRRRR